MKNNMQKQVNRALLLVFLVMLLVLVSMYAIFALPHYQKSQIAQANTVSQVTASSERIFNEMDKIEALIKTNNELQLLLKSDDNIARIDLSNKVYEFIRVLQRFNNDIVYVGVLDKKDSEISFFSTFNPAIHNFYQQYRQGTLSDDYIFVFDALPSKNFNGYFLHLSPIYSISANIDGYGEILGTLVIAFEPRSFSEIFNSVEMDTNSVLILLDTQNRVCLSKDKSYLGNVFDIHKHTGTTQKIRDTEFTLFMTDFGNEFNTAFRNLSLLIVLLLALFTLFMLGAKIWLSRSILSPINDVVRRIETVDQSAPFTKLETYDNPTFGIIISTINNLIDNLHNLTRKIITTQESLHEAEERKKEATLNSLKSCINPHFLYNTLGCIRSVALKKDAGDIAEMASALTNLFRYSIKGSDFCTIGDELDIVTQYMTIMRYRFNGKFRLAIEMSDEIYQSQIPKMIIQPLVENAITYGLEASENGGTITIYGKHTNNKIILTISDDGKGIDHKKLELLRENLQNSGRTLPDSIGLVNVNERIKLYYGSAYGLSLEGNEDRGFRVQITLPSNNNKTD